MHRKWQTRNFLLRRAREFSYFLVNPSHENQFLSCVAFPILLHCLILRIFVLIKFSFLSPSEFSNAARSHKLIFSQIWVSCSQNLILENDSLLGPTLCKVSKELNKYIISMISWQMAQILSKMLEKVNPWTIGKTIHKWDIVREYHIWHMCLSYLFTMHVYIILITFYIFIKYHFYHILLSSFVRLSPLLHSY